MILLPAVFLAVGLATEKVIIAGDFQQLPPILQTEQQVRSERSRFSSCWWNPLGAWRCLSRRAARYWTPEYKSAKRETLRMFSDAKIILAVPAASAEKYEDVGVPMIVYKSAIKLEPVLKVLKRH